MSLKTVRALLLILLTAGVSYWAARFSLDFSIYWHSSQATFLHGLDPYGDSTGLGWPMWYRYPPFFLLPVLALAWLPLGPAAFIWATGKCAASILLIRALVVRLDVSCGWYRWFPAAAVAAPVWAQELRYGNAQFYVFAMTALALLWARKYPKWAGASLGTAIAIKLWPLFFVPLLIIQRGRKAVVAGLIVAVVLTLLPMAVFGPSTTIDWYGDWYEQESTISADAGAMWFPSQSFYGIARRHLSAIDYSAMPDPNYQTIHWAELSPKAVRMVWFGAASLICTAFFIGAWRAPAGRDLEWAALGFCVLILFQPFAHKIALTVLLWPALVAAVRVEGWAQWTFYAAAVLSLAQVFLPSDTQRLLAVYGLDGLVVLLTAVALLPAALGARDSGEAR